MNDMDIRCLLAVAASKSFTAAAEELFLTQQAVSKYISNIEKELGVKLFVREYGRVTATEAGERYIELFNELKDGLNKLSHETAGYYDKLVQNFRIGYSLWIDPFGEIHRGIDGFSRKNPETAFTGQQYHNDLLIAGLNSGELDVAIISGAQIPLESEFAAEAIAKEDICLFVHD
ncbi:MAG: LysR family transcriptional regulator, partial [Clostridiales bacterium]|nr:LysR family transcriptional regulator [Clostridiales bacterium]